MPVGPGQDLLHYRLVEKIGEGGMGVVWKADDTKLDRQVAVKVLPEELSQDTQRLARFEREAKLLAALNHPNIAAIYGFESAEEIHFLVLELVDGQTLAEVIRNGPLPVSEALDVCCQVAEGLEAAHAEGVIHRDLKPGNVIVTGDGKAKVLDFGLAKELASGKGEGGGPSDLSLSPTVTFAGTQAGVVLGTAPYMSPEQTRGKPLDRRTDIWSFGCLLYECLTGSQTFGGETIPDTLSGILQNEPDWSKLPDRTPRRVSDLLERCLEKKPRNRLHDIADARIDLERSVATREWTTSGIARAAAEDAGARVRPAKLVGLLGLGVLVGATATALLTGVFSPTATERPHRRFSLQTSGQTLVMPKISPDGKTIAYAADGKLWLRFLDHLAPREVPDGEDTSPLAWSPDGTWLVVADTRELSKIHVRDGTRTTLTRQDVIAPAAAGAAWEPDGTITFCTAASGLLTVPAQGGTVSSRLEAAEGEQDFHAVNALPGGRGVLFVVHRDEGMDTIDVLSEGSRRNVVQLPGTLLANPVYSSTGHVLYSSGGVFDAADLWAVPFSLDRLEVTGKPFLVSERGALPSVSEDGTLVHYSARAPSKTRLVRVDRAGAVIEQLGEPGIAHNGPACSPDGRRVAFSSVVDGNRDIWTLDVTSGTQQRLTLEPSEEDAPAWSPSGDRIAFTAEVEPLSGTVKIKPSDGAGGAETVAPRAWLPDFSPDGKSLAFVQSTPALNPDLWYVDLESGADPVLFHEAGLWDVSPNLSPDGRFIAYTSDELGSVEVYLRPFPQGDGKWQLSLGGGLTPRWNASGTRVYFTQGNDLMEVAVQLRPSVNIGTPRKLFTWPFPPRSPWDFTPLFDVDPDGESFVMVEDTDPEAAWSGIVIVENWIAEFDE